MQRQERNLTRKHSGMETGHDLTNSRCQCQSFPVDAIHNSLSTSGLSHPWGGWKGRQPIRRFYFRWSFKKLLKKKRVTGKQRYCTFLRPYILLAMPFPTSQPTWGPPPNTRGQYCIVYVRSTEILTVQYLFVLSSFRTSHQQFPILDRTISRFIRELGWPMLLSGGVGWLLSFRDHENLIKSSLSYESTYTQTDSGLWS